MSIWWNISLVQASFLLFWSCRFLVICLFVSLLSFDDPRWFPIGIFLLFFGNFKLFFTLFINTIFACFSFFHPVLSFNSLFDIRSFLGIPLTPSVSGVLFKHIHVVFLFFKHCVMLFQFNKFIQLNIEYYIIGSSDIFLFIKNYARIDGIKYHKHKLSYQWKNMGGWIVSPWTTIFQLVIFNSVELFLMRYHLSQLIFLIFFWHNFWLTEIF